VNKDWLLLQKKVAVTVFMQLSFGQFLNYQEDYSVLFLKNGPTIKQDDEPMLL
jgi:hypothetical protein